MTTQRNGLLATLAIQCVQPDTGQTGCFLFGGETHHNKGSAKTPVFPDLVGLLTWCQSNGWTPIGNADRYIFHNYNL